MFGNGFPKLTTCAVAVAAVTLFLAVAAVASASTLVGDPGDRSLTLDSSTLDLGPLGSATNSASGPIATSVAPDGSFSVPADTLVWQIQGQLPSGMTSVGVICNNVTASWSSVTRAASVAASAPGAGLLDPAGNIAGLSFDSVVTPATVHVPVSYSGTIACVATSGSTMIDCTFDPLTMPVSLAGTATNDVHAGALDLSGAPSAQPAAPTCSGGAVLGDALASVISALQTALSQGANPGSLVLDATMSPGAHEPSAPSFQSASTLSGTPAVGSTLTCTPAATSGLPVPALTTSWLRDGAPIDGATGATYAVSPADAGHALACRTDAVNVAGSASQTSDAMAIPAQQPVTTGGQSQGGSADTSQAPHTTPPARCLVPRLKGLTPAAAKKKLRKARCGVGRIKHAKGKKRQRGRILSSSPKAGTKKAAGFRVGLVVGR